jgi:hypothetical protein
LLQRLGHAASLGASSSATTIEESFITPVRVIFQLLHPLMGLHKGV